MLAGVGATGTATSQLSAGLSAVTAFDGAFTTALAGAAVLAGARHRARR